jgi:hypothetical protein
MRNEEDDSNEDTSPIYINGPINCVRMQGNINNIDKVVYLFMDYHPILSECSELDSIDFKSYFVKIAKKLPEKVDFFFETSKFAMDIFAENKNYKTFRGRYIDSVKKIYASEFKMDKNNKIISSETFKNVRFHYVDIRFPFAVFVYKKTDEFTNFCRNHLNEGTLTQLDCTELSKKLNECQSLVTLLYDFLNYPDKVYEKLKNTHPKSIFEYKIFKKIQDKYYNTNVKNIIKNIIDTHIKGNYDDSMNLITKTLNFIDEIKIKLIESDIRNDSVKDIIEYGDDMRFIIESVSKLYVMVLTLNSKLEDLFLSYMDIYFIRRMCDKDYIKRSIVYTGASHSAFYIYILGKYFDFKVTHYSYCDLDNLDKINKKIRKSESYLEVDKIFSPKKLVQCTNMTKFPKNFT